MEYNKKFGLLKGLSEIYICEVNDTADAYTPVGDPEQLIPAGELKVTKSTEKTQFYYDNNMYDEIGREAPSEMELIGAAVRPAFLAWIEGKTVDSTTGAIFDDGDWHKKFYAISGKKDYNDGTSEYFWFHKCSFSGAEESTKTKDDTTDASGATLPFVAYNTIFKFAATGTHQKVTRIDTAETSIKAEKSWTSQIVTPDNIGTVCEKVTQ